MTRLKLLGLWHVDRPALWCSCANYGRFPSLSPRNSNSVCYSTGERNTSYGFALLISYFVSFLLTSLLIRFGKAWTQNRFTITLLMSETLENFFIISSHNCSSCLISLCSLYLNFCFSVYLFAFILYCENNGECCWGWSVTLCFCYNIIP